MYANNAQRSGGARDDRQRSPAECNQPALTWNRSIDAVANQRPHVTRFAKGRQTCRRATAESHAIVSPAKVSRCRSPSSDNRFMFGRSRKKRGSCGRDINRVIKRRLIRGQGNSGIPLRVASQLWAGPRATLLAAVASLPGSSLFALPHVVFVFRYCCRRPMRTGDRRSLSRRP